ncbi:MAG: ribonuclease D [Nocardioidaceae bacterium]|nr:ribonuclease D [Nocardioidaceae bacterium]
MTDGPASPPPAEQGPHEQEPAEAAPLLVLSGALPAVVETRADLALTVEALAGGSGPFAVDAERASGHRYSQRAYLLQLRRAGAGTALIDPVPFGDVPNDSLEPLATALGDTEWIIHAASQDLPCLAELGMRPRRLFDTELAARLLNYPRVGLGIMVGDLLGFRMRKEHSAVDWSKRPLPESWLLYAALDVELLIELRNVLAAQLEAHGKSEWARQEFAAWATMPEPTPRREPWRRTSGIHKVRGRRGLAIVRAMWEQRDELARLRDVTASRIITDAAIVAAASAAPDSRNALGRLPAFTSRGGQRYLKEFSAAVAEALSLTERDLPQLAPQQDGPPPARAWADKDPAAAARLGRCRETVIGLAELHDLPQENLLAPDAVRRLAWTPPEPATVEAVTALLDDLGARPWQVEITAAALAEALQSDQ